MEIKAQDISFVINSRPIIAGIDLAVKNQEFVGIIGPNGSGKSTFLKCLYRVLKPNSGAIYLGKNSLAELSVRESAKSLAVVAQHNFHNFDFKVLDVVMMGRAPHKKILERDNANDYEIACKSLALVGLANFKERNFSTLSGGEQQRVILARALTQQTKVVILDEPTNHLDIKYQLQLLDIIKGLKITVLAAIHDLNIAATYCDRLYALKSGAIFASGTPEELLQEKFIYDLFEVRAEIFYNKLGKKVVAFKSFLE